MATATAEPPAESKNDVEGRIFYNTTTECRYKDKHDHWQTSHSFDETQLAVLSDLAADARRFIRGLRAQEKAEKA